MQILLESADAADREVLRKDLIADAVERVESAESLLGIFLLLAGNRLVVGGLPVELEFADASFCLRGGAVCIACAGTKHAIREALETQRHIQGVGNGKAVASSSFFRSVMAGPPSKRTATPL
jgi:hypothetical protein